jgi:hypothetical protein
MILLFDIIMGCKMKSIILRGIPDNLYEELKNRSKKESKSMNKLLLSMLKNDCNPDGKSVKKKKRFTDLDRLFGKWNSEEYGKMKEAVAVQRGIDEEIWK